MIAETHDLSNQNVIPIRREVRNNVMTNKKRGFAALYRSLLDEDWTKDAYLLAAWTRLVLRASASEQVVTYNGQDWTIGRGQLVIIPARFANELQDRNGKPLTRDTVIRMLKWFESKKMISISGYEKGTVITVCNYDPYQSLIRLVQPAQGAAQGAAQLPAQHEASDGASSQGDAAQLPAQGAAQLPAPEEQPCKTTIRDKDLNPLGRESSKADPQTPDEQVVIPPDAAIHEKRGKSLRWGTADDLRAAEWFTEIRTKAFAAKGISNPKKPPLAAWANEIRLMRQHDNRTHHDICGLFAWVCRTGRELEFCQSPATLRERWDQLQLRKINAERGVTAKPLSNIAAAQLAAQSMGVSYDDNEPL